MECRGFRYYGHFEGDAMLYVTEEEKKRNRARDPIENVKKRALERGLVSAAQLGEVDARELVEGAGAVRGEEVRVDPGGAAGHRLHHTTPVAQLEKGDLAARPLLDQPGAQLDPLADPTVIEIFGDAAQAAPLMEQVADLGNGQYMEFYRRNFDNEEMATL